MMIWNWLLGFVTIVLRGDELPRFLRLCSNKGLLVWNVCHRDWNEIQVCMRKSDIFLAKEALRKTRTQIKIVKRDGLPFLVFRYRKKVVYFGSVVAAIIVLMLLSQYIWRIEIVGNSYLSEERLITYLEDNTCGVGIKKQRINPPELEKMMLKDFPEIIWNSISIHGTTLHISIKEQIPEDEIRQEEDTIDRDLVAPIRGTVQSIYVRRGTAAVAVGDKVKKGDPLVYGWIPIYNDSGTEIVKYYGADADADVYVTGKISIHNEINRRHQNRLYSGKERRYIYYGSLQHQYNVIPILYGKIQHTSMNSIRQVYLMDTIPLPIYRNIVREREFTFYDEDYTNDELRALQNRFCQDFIEKLAEKGVQITDKNVMISYGKNGSVMDGELHCLYPASEYAPSTIPEVINTRNDTL
ncbi:MAG: sporulation protein YqfD [Lachnospiraceae bacterium]|nr:sporulation protein YqfD [Lachnospiraceae bacterium]